METSVHSYQSTVSTNCWSHVFSPNTTSQWKSGCSSSCWIVAALFTLSWCTCWRHTCMLLLTPSTSASWPNNRRWALWTPLMRNKSWLCLLTMRVVLVLLVTLSRKLFWVRGFNYYYCIQCDQGWNKTLWIDAQSTNDFSQNSVSFFMLT